MRRLVARTAFASLLVACSGRGNGASTSVTRDSMGITIVENPAPVYPEGEDAVALGEPVVSLDDSIATGGQPYIGDAMRLANGDFLVAAGSEARWFDPKGMLLRTIGGSGEGPGEFRGIQKILLRGDTVILSGYSNTSKLAFFGPNGSHIRDELLDRDRFQALGRWAECQQLVLPDGSRLACMVDSTIPLSATNRASTIDDRGWSSPGPGLLRQMHRLHLVTAALDTTYPLGIDIGLEQFGVDNGGGDVSFMMHPMYARTLVAFGGTPLRVAIATNPEWEVQLWTPQGHLERIVRLTNGRRVPTAEEIGTASRLLREGELSRSRDTAATLKAVAAVPTPDSLPGILALAMSRTGELAATRGGVWAEEFPTIIDFFGADGRWTGMRVMPARWRLLDFGPDYLLGVRYDGDDLPHVEMYKLDTAAP
ncbi:MAG: hypothetical protein ABI542_06775 [Gemmatimonadota bacterium]